MTIYTGETTLAAQALVSANAVSESVLAAALSGFGNVRSVLHKPDETNSIGHEVLFQSELTVSMYIGVVAIPKQY
jgi:hypothetical protein